MRVLFVEVAGLPAFDTMSVRFFTSVIRPEIAIQVNDSSGKNYTELLRTYFASRQKMAGCLWRSGSPLGEPLGPISFHSATVWVRIYSLGEVRLAAMQNWVLGLQVCRTVSTSWLLRYG